MYTYIFHGIGSIVGSLIFGPIMDKLGYKSALTFLLLQIVAVGIGLLVNNHFHIFNFTAYLLMFGIGSVEFTVHCFLNTLLGFQFTTYPAIVPFGARLFLQNVCTALVALGLTFWSLTSET